MIAVTDEPRPTLAITKAKAVSPRSKTSRTYETVATMAAAPAVASAILRVSACRRDGSLRRMRVPVVSSAKKLGNEILGSFFFTYGITVTATSEAETKYVNASNQKTQR